MGCERKPDHVPVELWNAIWSSLWINSTTNMAQFIHDVVQHGAKNARTPTPEKS